MPSTAREPDWIDSGGYGGLPVRRLCSDCIEGHKLSPRKEEVPPAGQAAPIWLCQVCAPWPTPRCEAHARLHVYKEQHTQISLVSVKKSRALLAE